MSKLLILGAGGYGQVAREAALATGIWDDVRFLDDACRSPLVIGKCIDYTEKLCEFSEAYAAFGDNRLRIEWLEKLKAAGYKIPIIIHPRAFVSESASLSEGCVVLQNAVVNTHCTAEVGCLINCGAVVDHDSHLQLGVHVGLNSVIKANCTIEKFTKVSAGAVIHHTRRKIDGVNDENLEDALYSFDFGAHISYVKPFGSGHINDTYAIYIGDEGSETLGYVIQRVNTNVFKKPQEVMQNIFGVTEYLRKVIIASGGDPERETLSYIKTLTGKNYFTDNMGQPWRCYHYIEKSLCYQSVGNPEHFYHSAKAFGGFLRLLENYPADTLFETIEKFHDTRSRLTAFKKALARDIMGRAQNVKTEIEFVLSRESQCAILMDLLEAGRLPLRVTHNDTKLNNILFDEETGKALCVIDLDTIMPGLALNDYGDSIRFGATTAAEDEPDLDKVNFDLYLFEQYTKGYLEAAGEALTDTEKEYLPWGAKLMTFECGIRFLTDYLQGDTYFKVSRAGQNLDRCRTQFKLVSDMENCFDEMNSIVKKYS